MVANDDWSGGGEWVLLTYKLPREPSTPRSSVWRKLRRLGVAQLADGLVALPSDARTREALDWIADEVLGARGTATVWLARPGSVADERHLALQMSAERSAEYLDLAERTRSACDTAAAGGDGRRALRDLRNELRALRRRDYFAAEGKQQAIEALEALAEVVAAGTSGTSGTSGAPGAAEAPSPAAAPGRAPLGQGEVSR